MIEKELDTFKLVLSEQEIKQLKLTLMTRFTYMTIALSSDIDVQLQGLISLVEYDPSVLGTSHFGRVDN